MMLFDNTPDGWSETTLGEICSRAGGSIQTGPFGSQLHASDYVSQGIPSIMPANIAGGRVREDGIARITESDAERLSKYLVQEGDIVYSRRGDVEKCALITESENGWLCGTGCLRVRLGKDVADPLFASYFLSHPESKAWISRHAVGATMPNLNTGILSDVPFLLPPSMEQEAIAHILGTLDDKIELNQKMNQTLDEIAKAIFKSWFVDFDPVRAKAEGRSTGLPPEISDLFPDELVDSEIGGIPKGWVIEEGRHLYSHQKGLSYKGKFLSDEDDDMPMLNLGSFAGNGKYRREKLKFYCGEFKDRHQIYEGDLLVANTDLTQDRLIIGSPILVPDTPNESEFYLHTHHTTKITPLEESGLTTTFIYFTFLQDSFRQRVSGFATGTTVLALPKDTFDALQVVIPSAPVRSRFEEVATLILNRCSLLAKEIEVLAELRDTLLPKLISGELRIPDAEKFLEEAGI